jgi:hypothetical protein
MRRSAQIKVDLTLFYSSLIKEPTREKNDRKFEAPQKSVPILTKGGTEKFEMEFVYFGFYSINGCTLFLESYF